jgi:hypothetical protein
MRLRLRFDPYSAGIRAYERGEVFDPDFGLRCKGWGTNSAQCLYERGRLKAAEQRPVQVRRSAPAA